MNQHIEQYIKQLLPINDTIYSAVREEAIENHIPIMEATSLNFLTVILQLVRPKKLLEIGTGIGYSALKMAEVCESCQIITLESDFKRAEQAKVNIAKYNKTDKIEVVYCDALDYLKNKNPIEFDVIFIDATKSKYQQFFELANPLLKENGLIISDNILFRGYVAGFKDTPKKYKRIVNNIQIYNKWLSRHTQYKTTFIPIGDGVALSFKTNK